MAADPTFSDSDSEVKPLSLKQSYRALWNAPIGISKFTPSGRIFFVNPAMCTLLGYNSPEELLSHVPGLSNQVYADPKDMVRLRSLLEAQGEALNYECRMKCRDGSLVWVSINAHAVLDDHGQLSHTQCFVRDISTRKEAEEVLTNEHEFLKVLFDSLQEAVVVCNEYGRLVRFNEAARLLHGHQEQPIAPDRWSEVYSLYRTDGATLLPVAEIPLYRALQGERFHDAEIVVHPPRYKKPRFLSCNGQPLFDAQGRKVGGLVAMNDITGRKRAEEALLQKSRKLEERVKELDCLYSLSQLLNNSEISWRELLQSAVELIPSSLQYPDIAAARILLEDDVFSSPGFQEAEWKYAADIFISGIKAGRIEVFYLQEVPGAGDRPFLLQERKLIESIAERLGKHLERIRTKEALRRSEEKFRALIENINEIIFAHSLNGYITFVSSNVSELLGYSEQEMLGRPVSQFIHPDDLPNFQKHFMALTEQGSSVDGVEYRVLHKNGEWRWYAAKGSALRSVQGETLSLVGMGHDITKRKQAEMALRESEKRFRVIVEAGPEAILIHAENRCVYANPQALQLLGAEDESQLLGLSILERIHPDFHGQVQERISRLVQERRPVKEKLELKCLRLDGSEVWVETSAHPVVFQEKEANLVFVRDITERKELEQLKEDVDRIARHDLKTPLNGIVGLPQALLSEENLNADQKELIGYIQQAGYRMLNMINMSLSLYQMEKGEYNFYPQPTNLMPIIRDIQRELSSMCSTYKNDISVSLPGARQDDSFVVNGERLLCYTMLSNLIKNAVERTPAGGTVHIQLEEPETNQARISVHNPGVIPKKIRDRLGQKYVTAEKQHGTGLGVYSVLLIARTMNGSLTWSSSRESGTCFKVLLPMPEQNMRKWAHCASH
ncbi:MAG: PAS domain S-box protein [Desulfovermiculus sp.]